MQFSSLPGLKEVQCLPLGWISGEYSMGGKEKQNFSIFLLSVAYYVCLEMNNNLCFSTFWVTDYPDLGFDLLSALCMALALCSFPLLLWRVSFSLITLNMLLEIKLIRRAATFFGHFSRWKVTKYTSHKCPFFFLVFTDTWFSWITLAPPFYRDCSCTLRLWKRHHDSMAQQYHCQPLLNALPCFHPHSEWWSSSLLLILVIYWASGHSHHSLPFRFQSG